MSHQHPRRTALEHGAAQVIVVARRHGTICPKARRYSTGPYRAHVVSKLWMFLMDCLEQMKTCFTSTSVSLLFLCLALLQASPHAAQKARASVQSTVLARQLTTWTSSSRGTRNTSTTPRPTLSSSCDGSSSMKHLAASCRNAGRNRLGTGVCNCYCSTLHALHALHALHGGLLRISFRWSTTATPSPWATFGSWPTTWRSFLRWQAHREDREGLLVFMPRRSRREWFESGKPLSRSCIPVLRPGK